MSDYARVSGIVYLGECFTDVAAGGAHNWYCYTNILECLWAISLIVLGIYLIIKKKKMFSDKRGLTRKQTILSLMVVNLFAYLLCQWTVFTPLLYFPEYYFQYIFFCFTIYYFGRKSIMLGMLNMRIDVTNQDIDPIIQLKLSKLFCIGLCSFFTIIFIMNYIEYFIQGAANYDLCQENFFNIVTTVGFFMQGLFILQVKQLSRQVDKNLQAYNMDESMMQIKDDIQSRQKSLWMLVIICFIGSLVNFSQNLFFVAENVAKRNQNYQCTYFSFQNDQQLSNDLNAVIGTSIKFTDFFLPYFVTVKVFWPVVKPIEDTKDKEDHVDTYEIRFRQETNQNQEIATELV